MRDIEERGKDSKTGTETKKRASGEQGREGVRGLLGGIGWLLGFTFNPCSLMKFLLSSIWFQL